MLLLGPAGHYYECLGTWKCGTCAEISLPQVAQPQPPEAFDPWAVALTSDADSMVSVLLVVSLDLVRPPLFLPFISGNN